MNDLELIKAFAEIDGVKVIEEWSCTYDKNTALEYNPITDLALNCAARDKYRVEIDYYVKEATIDCESSAFIIDSRIGRAVIECIVKANK